MLRSLGPAASGLLAPQPAAANEIRDALDAGWRKTAIELLAGSWRDQVTAAAAIALGGGGEASSPEPAGEPTAAPTATLTAELTATLTAELTAALWRAVDGASWVAPQLVAAAAIADAEFEPRAAERLTDGARRPPKTIGALVRAYNRCPARRMPVLAQLGVHDRTLATEEARIGVRGVDGWLDYFGAISRSS